MARLMILTGGHCCVWNKWRLLWVGCEYLTAFLGDTFAVRRTEYKSGVHRCWPLMHRLSAAAVRVPRWDPWGLCIPQGFDTLWYLRDGAVSGGEHLIFRSEPSIDRQWYIRCQVFNIASPVGRPTLHNLHNLFSKSFREWGREAKDHGSMPWILI